MRLPSIFFIIALTLVTIFRTDCAVAQTAETETTRKVLNRVLPVYPTMARNLNLTGTVKLEALVLPNGTVKSIQVKGGNPLLAQAAQNAVREWRWQKSEHDSTEELEFKFHP
jgi:TonB family protein